MERIITTTLLQYLLFITIFNFHYVFSSAQAPSIKWQKALGGTMWEGPNTFLKTSDGGYLVAGVAESKDGDVTGLRGGTDIWIIKLDAAGDVKWKKCYGGSNDEYSARILEIPGSGFVIGSGTLSNNGNIKGNNGGRDIWIFRIDLQGNLLWQRCLGGTKDEYPESIALASDGNVLATFFSISTNGYMVGNHGKNDAFVGKISATDGRVLWSKVLGGSEDDAFYEVQPTNDGGCVLAGTTNSTNGDISGLRGLTDLWVVKLDNNGNTNWKRVFGGSERELGPRIKCATDGTYFIALNTNSTDGDVVRTDNTRLGGWTIKLSSAGEIINQHFQNPGGGNIADLKITNDGGVIVARSGTLNESGTGPGNILQKFTGNLEHVWINEYGGSKEDYLLAVQPINDGTFVSFGYSQSEDQPGYDGDYDIWLMKVDASGNKLWENLYGGLSSERLHGSCNHLYHISTSVLNIMDGDGNIFFAASTSSNNTGDLTGTSLHYSSRVGLKPDIWVAKLSTTASAQITSKAVQQESESFKKSFNHKIYPNPARHSATLQFTAVEDNSTLVELFNISGARIQVKSITGVQVGGFYQHTFNLSGLPAGNYIYRLRNGSIIREGKIIKSN